MLTTQQLADDQLPWQQDALVKNVTIINDKFREFIHDMW